MIASARHRTFVLCGVFVLLAAAVSAAFSPAFQAGFVYDDFRFLRFNPFLDAPLDMGALFFDKHSFSGDKEPDIYRPLCTLFFYAEKRIGEGEPLTHHAAGLALHAVNALLVFLLLVRLLSAGGERKNTHWACLFGAALFALHPLQVESVVWISSRAGQLSAFFTLLALLAVLRLGARANAATLPTVAAVFCLTLLSSFSKEAGVVTGGMVLVLWLCIASLRNRRVFFCVLGSLVAGAVFMAIRSHVMEGNLSQVPPHGGDRISGLLYGAYGCAYQIGLLFRPWFNNLDYQNGFFDDTPFAWLTAGTVLYVLLVAAGVVLVRRLPLVACGVLLFAAAQFPTSSLLVTLRSLVNDRYLYVPLLGAALVAAALLDRCDRRATARRISRFLAVAVLLLLASVTFGRSAEWRNGRTLWEAALETHPTSVKAHVGLSRALLGEGRAQEALEVAVKGYSREPYGSPGRMNAIYKASEALVSLEQFEKAKGLLRGLIAEAESPRRTGEFRLFEKAGFDLWKLEIAAGLFDEAAVVVGKLIRHGGETPYNLDMLGMTLLDAGRASEAEEAFERGADLPGEYAGIHYHLADLYEGTGRGEAAAAERRRGDRKKADQGSSSK
jgi:protein O-mannosyl-transferase